MECLWDGHVLFLGIKHNHLCETGFHFDFPVRFRLVSIQNTCRISSVFLNTCSFDFNFDFFLNVNIFND